MDWDLRRGAEEELAEGVERSRQNWHSARLSDPCRIVPMAARTHKLAFQGY